MTDIPRHLRSAPRAYDKAREDDRAWFEAHPGERYRLRLEIDGEFSLDTRKNVQSHAPPGHVRLVAVRQSIADPNRRDRFVIATVTKEFAEKEGPPPETVASAQQGAMLEGMWAEAMRQARLEEDVKREVAALKEGM